MKFLKAYHRPAIAMLSGVAMILAGCASSVVEPPRVVADAHGITVRPAAGPAERIRIRAVTPDILRVTAFPTDDTALPDSLMIDKPSSAPFTVREAANEVTIAVAGASATVSLESGLVQFRNAAGEVVLEEDERAEFVPVSIEGARFYELQQRWNRGTREAFYGLGQHQQGRLNLNGEDVELAQHNVVIAMPFVVSERNYGVLWDNNSLSRFGDPRPYGTLSGKLTVRDLDGRAGGLTASYRVGGKLVAQRVEADPNYQFLGDQGNWPQGLAQDTEGLSVTWEGSIDAATPGVHRFRIYQSGYTRVYVDGELVVDSWRQNWNPWYRNFDIDMQPGQRRALRIEWQVDGGYLRLLHQDPLPADERHSLNLYSELGQAIDYYFIGGESLQDVVAGYRELTGRSRMLPRWAYGFWQSRERYRTQDELLDVLREYRRRAIPIDNIVLDWFYWDEDAWGSHEFDASRFPDPAGMVDAVHDLNAQIMISVWPKFYPTTRHYRELEAIGAVYPHTIDTQQVDWVGAGYVSTFYDPYNANARTLYWQQIEDKLAGLGFDAWWMDATEPDLGSNADIDERKARMTPTALGPGAAFFNSYALMNAKAVFDGLKAREPDSRVMILTRSGFPGLQRFGAATWSGDIASTWSDFRNQVPAGLGMSLAGLANWTFDIGGFTPEARYAREEMSSADRVEWRELYTRWFQFGAFAPLFRSHGQYPFREIFNIADEGSIEYSSMVWHAQLRYRLLPYIYSLAGNVTRNHDTIMRPLAMDFPGDPVVKDLGDQYLFGPSILVKPVTEFRAREVDVYLPGDNEWLDFHSGERYQGGQWIRAGAPLDRMPLFVRAGTILPVGPAVQYSDQALSAPVTLVVYTGADGRFELYEDDGESSAYLQGESSVIPMTYNDRDGTLTIGARVGSWDGMPVTRRFDVRWIDRQGKSATTFDVSPDASIDYRGESVTIRRERHTAEP